MEDSQDLNEQSVSLNSISVLLKNVVVRWLKIILEGIYCKKKFLLNIFLVKFWILFQDHKTYLWKCLLFLLNDIMFWGLPWLSSCKDNARKMRALKLCSVFYCLNSFKHPLYWVLSQRRLDGACGVDSQKYERWSISPAYLLFTLRMVTTVLKGFPDFAKVFTGLPCGSADKESTRNVGDLGSIPGLWRSPGEGKGCPWRIPWTVWFMKSQRVGHDWATFTLPREECTRLEAAILKFRFLNGKGLI